MLMTPDALIDAALKAGIPIPARGELEICNPDHFPHWCAFKKYQLGRRMTSSAEHYHNAEVLAALTASELKAMKLKGLLERGFKFTV